MPHSCFRRVLTISLLLLGACGVSGYGEYRKRLPNGERVPHPCRANFYWHGVGHINALGGGNRNDFGKDFASQGHMWTQELCRLDSDGDGMTNGQELGDPNCVWTADSGNLPSRTTDITHPGVCDPFDSPACQAKNAWVSCKGSELECDALNAPDVRNFTIRFPETDVPAEDTTYICMIFDVPSDQDYHYIGSKPLIDNENVMHHVVVYGCSDTSEELPTEPYKCGMDAGKGCTAALGSWTVGSPGECLNDNFGLVFGKSKYTRIALEFHWNNPNEVSGWKDSSGMTIFYTPNLRKNNGSLMSLGQMNLAIPPGQSEVTFRGECTSECTRKLMTEPIYVPMAGNHMHYLGRSASVELRRNGQRVQYLTNEPEFNYDNPRYFKYDDPVEILPGDSLVTTCTYQSTYKKKWVFYGDGTSDEMCFGFLWYYPEHALKHGVCVSWKSINLCVGESLIEENCNVWEFLFESDPESKALSNALRDNCNLLANICTPECKMAAMDILKHPCLSGGDISDYVRNLMRQSKEGLEFLGMMTICDVNKNDFTYPHTSGAGALMASLALIFLALIMA
ncbi:DBH-like monooxygenase protein 1 [Haliotis rubra]|uniref:DBH-like monooxygenase protein 1 n=1 Tax=Haliotis rubra TaxID=36100 RepID=UPI001EE51498|nr:DBH-like monooxygenase protein 1 [Haliotis rubra]